MFTRAIGLKKYCGVVVHKLTSQCHNLEKLKCHFRVSLAVNTAQYSSDQQFGLRRSVNRNYEGTRIEFGGLEKSDVSSRVPLTPATSPVLRPAALRDYGNIQSDITVHIAGQDAKMKPVELYQAIKSMSASSILSLVEQSADILDSTHLALCLRTFYQSIHISETPVSQLVWAGLEENSQEASIAVRMLCGAVAAHARTLEPSVMADMLEYMVGLGMNTTDDCIVIMLALCQHFANDLALDQLITIGHCLQTLEKNVKSDGHNSDGLRDDVELAAAVAVVGELVRLRTDVLSVSGLSLWHCLTLLDVYMERLSPDTIRQLLSVMWRERGEFGDKESYCVVALHCLARVERGERRNVRALIHWCEEHVVSKLERLSVDEISVLIKAYTLLNKYNSHMFQDVGNYFLTSDKGLEDHTGPAGLMNDWGSIDRSSRTVFIRGTTSSDSSTHPISDIHSATDSRLSIEDRTGATAVDTDTRLSMKDHTGATAVDTDTRLSIEDHAGATAVDTDTRLLTWKDLAQLGYHHRRLFSDILNDDCWTSCGYESSLSASEVVEVAGQVADCVRESELEVVEKGLLKWIDGMIDKRIAEIKATLSPDFLIDFCLQLVSLKLLDSAHKLSGSCLKHDAVVLRNLDKSTEVEKISLSERLTLLRRYMVTSGDILCSSSAAIQRKPVSHLQAAFRRIGLSSTSACVTQSSQLYVDHILEYSHSCSPSGVSRVAVVYWPSRYFCRSTGQLRAIPRLYVTALQEQDQYRVLVINESQWNRLDEKERLPWLERQLGSIDSLQDLVLW